MERLDEQPKIVVVSGVEVMFKLLMHGWYII